MKKHILIPIFIFFISIFLIGCLEFTENTSSGDTSKIELVNYKIYTYENDWGEENYAKKLSEGFKPNLANAHGYIIEGTIRNIAGEMINAKVIANFYDKNNNFLHSEDDNLNNIANSYTRDFVIKLSKSSKYFENVNSVKFDLEVV